MCFNIPYRNYPDFDYIYIANNYNILMRNLSVRHHVMNMKHLLMTAHGYLVLHVHPRDRILKFKLELECLALGTPRGPCEASSRPPSARWVG